MNGVGSGTFSANGGLQPDRCRQLSATGGFSSKGVVKHLVAALVGLVCLGFLSPLAAAPLATPAGLAPGAHFRFIYLTSGQIAATSTAIADYNSFVQTQASGATYAGATVNWKAVGSTATVDARVNVGGFGTNVPVYLVNGTRVSNDMTSNGGGLWGAATTNLLAPVNIGIDGLTITTYLYPWTGSNSLGLKYVGNELGTAYARYGSPTNSTLNQRWIDEGSYYSTDPNKMYAVSEELVVPAAAPVPTLSQWALTVLGLVLAGLALIQFRRSRPTPA